MTTEKNGLMLGIPELKVAEDDPKDRRAAVRRVAVSAEDAEDFAALLGALGLTAEEGR